MPSAITPTRDGFRLRHAWLVLDDNIGRHRPHRSDRQPLQEL